MNVKGQYHLPMTTLEECLLEIGKLNSGRRMRRETLRPWASPNPQSLGVEAFALHSFLLKNRGGIPCGALDFALKRPWWRRLICSCWYGSMGFKALGFTSFT